jgi:hypothetical protein
VAAVSGVTRSTQQGVPGSYEVLLVIAVPRSRSAGRSAVGRFRGHTVCALIYPA